VRRCLGILGLVAALTLAAAGTSAGHVRVTVKPKRGIPTSRFVVRFRNPTRTGTAGSMRRYEVLSASGPRGNGCVSGFALTLRPAAKGRRIKVTLRPRRLGGVWCAGTFEVRLDEVRTFVCAGVCAGPAVIPHMLGRFSFRVRRPSTGSSHSPAA
jgi:hypothetical protein